MFRYFIELAYNGSNYNGWQIQPNAPSIQQEINRALSTLLRQEINVVGAGRTDTGVNASFFIAHFDVTEEITDPIQVAYKMNRLLGVHIAIRRIYPVAPDVHARFNAMSRTYKYFIDKEKNPFTYSFAYHIFPLPDVNKMNDACKILFEYTDFTSFSKLHTDTKTNNCKIRQAEWTEQGHQLVFTIKADRFLRNMVRAIVGTMLEIGQGKMTPEEFRKVIENKNRCSAGISVPGNALFLYHIEYKPSDLGSDGMKNEE